MKEAEEFVDSLFEEFGEDCEAICAAIEIKMLLEEMGIE